MPVISRFLGIIVKIFFVGKEHKPPHFHAIYGEYNAAFDIATGEMLEGDMPRRAKNLIQEWASLHKDELEQIWDTQEFRTLPGLE